MNANPTESIHLAAKALLESKSILIGAGAGMGVDSGLPDFRGKEGFWKDIRACRRLLEARIVFAHNEQSRGSEQAARGAAWEESSGLDGAVGIGLVLHFAQYWSIQYQVVLNSYNTGVSNIE